MMNKSATMCITIMTLFANKLLKSLRVRASLAMPQIKTMHDRVSKTYSASKVILATLKFPFSLNSHKRKDNATLSMLKKMLNAFSLHLCLSSGRKFDSTQKYFVTEREKPAGQVER